MKAFLLIGSMIAALTATAPAMADHEREQRSDQRRESQRDDRYERDRYDDRRNGGGGRREQQLSREEREQLRRDVQDYGRDIYRDKGKGRRR